MKVRIIEQPLGLLSLAGATGIEWPDVGDTIDLPDVVAEDMIASGRAEKVAAKKVEKRPASTAKVEKRTASKKS